jgi:hypothetical protein
VSESFGSGGGTFFGLYTDVAKLNMYNNIIWDNTALNGADIFIGTDFAPVINVYNNDFDPAKVSGPFTNEGGNINADPLFVDAANGDYHLRLNSPCIDAGDPVETLTVDYTGSSNLEVDSVTGVFLGDTVWLTDAVNTESEEVVGTTATSITVANSFTNNYRVADGAYVYTQFSDFLNEPEPNGGRINIGAYGGTGNARTTTIKGDIDGDGIVDLSDALLAFQILVGMTPSQSVNLSADVNGDGKIGIEELIYILQEVSALR